MSPSVSIDVVDIYLRNLPTHTVYNLLPKLESVIFAQYSVVKQRFNIIHIM